MKRAPVAAALLAVTAAALGIGAPVLQSARAIDAPPSFSQVGVTTAQVAGEPSIWVDKTASPPIVYAAEPAFGTNLFRSFDGGQTWTSTPVTTAGGGGDSDVVTDADGTVYVSDLLDRAGVLSTTLPISTSFDHGVSFDHMVLLDANAGAGIAWDRQWNAAEGHGHVVGVARADTLYASWVSRDQGRTFSGPHTIDAQAVRGGPIVFNPDGTILYGIDLGNNPTSGANEVRLAKSLDGGVTWTLHTIATNVGNAGSFNVVDVDDAGNLYATWASGGVNLAVSTDQGESWSAPIKLSPNGKTAMFPWVAAGESGRADIVWYQSDTGMLPDLGPDRGMPTTTWDVKMAQITGATTTSPTISVVTAAPKFHTGSICTAGLSCAGPQNAGLVNAPTPYDRRLLDFFEIALDTNGNALIAYPNDRPQTTTDPYDVLEPRSDLLVARQTNGTRARTTPIVDYPSVADLAPCAPKLFVDASGDENFTYDLTSSNWPQLDIVGGNATVVGDNMHLSVNFKDFSRIVPLPGIENVYFVTWTYSGTRYYVDASMTRAGVLNVTDGVVNNGVPSRTQKHVDTGSVVLGPNGGLELDIPLANIGTPPIGAVLRSIAAESDVYEGSPVHGVSPVSGLLFGVDDAGPGHDYAIAQTCPTP